MSLMSTLYTGYSGLQVSQLATDIVGNNIANTENPRYTRQKVDISSRFSLRMHPGDIGTGAQADQVVRIHDEFVYKRFRAASTNLEFQEFSDKILVEISKYFPDVDEVGIQRDLISFFNSWQKLASNPSEDAQKVVLAEATKNMGRSIQETRNKLSSMQEMLDELLVSAVDEVNRLANEIVTINKKIAALEATKYDHANKLRDERDYLELQLQKLSGAQIVKSPLKTMTEVDTNIADYSQQYSIYIGGFVLVEDLSVHPIKALAADNSSGAQKAIFFEHRDLTTTNITNKIVEGKIGSILDLRGRSFNSKTGESNDGKLQHYKDILDTFSKGIIQSVNQIYAGSATDDMSSDIIGDTRGLTARQAKIIDIADLGKEILRTNVQVGNMEIVTYAKDGTRIMPDIIVRVDPFNMSLKEIADAINAELNKHNLNGEALVEGGRLGFKTGTTGNKTELGAILINEDHSLVRSALDLTGSRKIYDLNNNEIPFTIKDGKFKVGVYDRNGTKVAERDIIIDQHSKSPLYSTLDGIAAQINMPHTDDNLDNDKTNDIDDFLVADFSGNRFGITTKDKNAGLYFNIVDEGTGFAGAIGLHKFLDGSSAKDIDLATNLKLNPPHIQAYDLPVIGNNNIANAMQQLQYNQIDYFDKNGKMSNDTIMGRYKYVAGVVAEDTATTRMSLNTANAIFASIETQRNSISKVNVDEELTNLIRFQAGYSANARVISTIQIMLDTLLGIKQ